jgi:XTP/dITP diphosphohydrolase
MKKLLIATTNKGKLHELSLFLEDLPLQLVSLTDVGITEEPEENGKNYTENSQIKALFYSKKSELPAVADDGGLEIVALGGAPGLKSHRWLGPDTTEEDIVAHMKKIAKSLPDDNRQAFFKTVVSLGFPDGRMKSFYGKVEGIIAKEPSLKYEPGYPYRSFFFVPKLNKFYFETELTPVELKKFNHRYKAVQKLRNYLQKELF